MQMELERIVDRALGALLVTGPTGSGKSTTLYAALADLARPERTLITIEDPVEYELPGTYQLQINPSSGLSFPSALRAMLRGDPDVLMVGEIRDAETANLALGASLSGHFLLSTLHTNDAPSAVTRLIEMGVEPYVISAGLAGVIGQRLARKLCLYCRQPYEPSPDVLATVAARRPDRRRRDLLPCGGVHLLQCRVPRTHRCLPAAHHRRRAATVHRRGRTRTTQSSPQPALQAWRRSGTTALRRSRPG